MRIFDLHCDTIMRLRMGEKLRENPPGHIDLVRMKKGEYLAQCFAIFIYTKAPVAPDGIAACREELRGGYEALARELAENGDMIRQARTIAEVEENARQGKMSAILTVEDAVSLGGELSELDLYRQMGVKMVTLTWKHENSLGYPCSEDPVFHALGLKPFGIEAVRRMEELGIAVDVSHLSEGGFWDVVQYAKKPFIASHSCADAVHHHPRNLTDRQLRAIADRGGLVGINFLSEFLKPVAPGTLRDSVTSGEDILRHLTHMRDVAGTDCLALGSDFDGIFCKLSFRDCGGVPQLIRCLEKAFTSDEIDKLCSLNAKRVFRALWDESEAR